MDPSQTEIIDNLAELNSSGDLAACVKESRTSRNRLSDPELVGWSYFFEYKSLFVLESDAEAYKVLIEAMNPTTGKVVIGLKNILWMLSTGAEVAFRLGSRDGINEMTDKAIVLAKGQVERIQMLITNRDMFLKKLSAVTRPTGDGSVSPEYTKLGEDADLLTSGGHYAEALEVYKQIRSAMIHKKNIDGFVASKVTLGVLVTLVRQERWEDALKVWITKEDGDVVYHVGVYSFSDAPQTTAEDLMLYNLISARLYGIGNSPAEESKKAIDSLLSTVLEWVDETKSTHWLPHIATCWYAAYTDAADDKIPDDWLAVLTEKFGSDVLSLPVSYPLPSIWEITWGDGTIIEYK